MAITMQDRFVVRAPIEDVWRFLIDPHQVVLCMPGASLERIESERAFHGAIKIAVGPFSTRYRGRVEFADVDEASHSARLTAEGEERGGGAARGEMTSTLRTVDDGTEVSVDISVEGASKIIDLGLGLTQNLAQELFEEFVDRVRARLEPGAESAPGEPPAGKAVHVVPLLAKALLRRFRPKNAERPRSG